MYNKNYFFYHLEPFLKPTIQMPNQLNCLIVSFRNGMFQRVTALCRCLRTREMEYKITCTGTGGHRSTCVRASAGMGCFVCT